MGRPRIHNKGLPARVYLSHGSYFFRPRAGRTVNLGREFAGAMAEYGRLMHGAWSGATGGERFTFHDIRAKTASDKETLGGAAALLGHASSDTTRRVYRRGGETVEPLK